MLSPGGNNNEIVAKTKLGKCKSAPVKITVELVINRYILGRGRGFFLILEINAIGQIFSWCDIAGIAISTRPGLFIGIKRLSNTGGSASTCITAARKGEGAIAVGNILGADIMNICWVAGASALANDLTVGRKEIMFMLNLRNPNILG